MPHVSPFVEHLTELLIEHEIGTVDRDETELLAMELETYLMNRNVGVGKQLNPDLLNTKGEGHEQSCRCHRTA